MVRYFYLNPNKNNVSLLSDVFNVQQKEKRGNVKDKLQNSVVLYDNTEYYYMNNITELNKVLNSGKEQTLYEVIFGECTQYFKLDIDIKDPTLNKTYVEGFILEMIQCLVDIVVMIYDVDSNIKDFIILSSHSNVKYSYHIIFKKIAFENNHECKKIFELLYDSFNHKLKKYMDGSVYKSTQNFRLLNSGKTKLKKTKFIVDTLNKYDIKSIEDTLVQNVTSKVVENILHKKNINIQVNTKMEITNIDVKNICKLLNKNDTKYFRYYKKVNNMILFKRISPSNCRICNKTHDKQNSLMLFIKPNWSKPYLNNNISHYVYQYCRRDGYVSNSNNKFTEECKSVLLGEVYISPTCEVPNNISLMFKNLDNYVKQPYKLEYDNFSDIKINEIYSKRYMDPYEFEDVLCIRANMGLGKTYQLKNYIKNNFDSDKSILYLSFRKSFTSQIKNALPDFKSYLDMKTDEIDFNKNKRIILQIESLFKLNVKNSYPDLIIIDESESIIDQLTSNLHTHKSVSFGKFKWLIKYSRQLIFMDANLSNRTYNLIDNLRGLTLNCKFIWNKYKINKEKTFNLTNNKSIWLDKLNISIRDGHKIAIAVNSKDVGKTLEQYILEINNKLKVKIISSENKDKDKNELFNNINKTLLQYDVFIYTPTLTAGVSFDKLHFDKIFGYFTNMSCNVEICRQMLHRIRHTKLSEYELYLEQIIKYVPTDRKTIERTINTSDPHIMIDYTSCGRPYVYKSDYYKIWIDTQIKNNLSIKNFILRFYNQLKTTGAKINILSKDYDVKNMIDVKSNSRMIQIKKLVKKSEANLILTADSISFEEYMDNKSNGDYNKYNLQKFKFVDLYDISFDNLSMEIITKFNNRHCIKLKKNYKNMLNKTNRFGSSINSYNIKDIITNLHQKLTEVKKFEYIGGDSEELENYNEAIIIRKSSYLIKQLYALKVLQLLNIKEINFDKIHIEESQIMNEKIIDLVGYKFNNYAKLKLDLILSKLNEMVNDELGYKISVYKKKIYIVQNKWLKQFHFFKFTLCII